MSNLDGYDRDRLTNSVTTALNGVNDGVLCSVMIVGVFTDGRTYRLWSGGDEAVNDQVRAALLQALPLTTPKRILTEDDGA